ncbi:MAG TPA: hypothetical protein VG722_11710, partial [Tepidisphaeraceae bacterium]|nr:hypothetical protein [Tepidisphaeraceae bacterium]
MRFDVSTSNNGVLLPHLNFPSANGHLPMLGGSSNQSAVEANGNTLSIYYDQFDTQAAQNGQPAQASFTEYPDPHDMAAVVQTWINKECTTTSSRDSWISLNEISSSTWQSNSTNQDGYSYRTWCADVISILKNGAAADSTHIAVPAHTGVIIFAPFGAPTGNSAADWATIDQNAVIGVERYIDGPTVANDGYSISAVQSFYQQSMNAWVNNEGVPASDLFLTEEYTVNSNGYGADGLSGSDWQEAIEVRALAAYNVGFGGYIGYAWSKYPPGTDSATLQSYEKAYASTMVLQSELPCWTGNDSDITGNSWADYLNWTGGLPSTTSAPYPLLASTNPNL